MVDSRRYEAEFLLNVVVIPKYHGREKDLKQAILPPDLPTCNLYIVSRAPRVTVIPESVRFTKSGELFLTLREQVKEIYREHEVYVQHFAPDTSDLTFHADWPYDEFHIIDSKGGRFGGPVTIILRAAGLLPEPLCRQEILYIGQAFGKVGERTAFDRLKSHSTLQRIYSETLPDTEIWLTLCSIDDVALNLTIDKPGRPIEKTDAENNEHIDRVYSRYESGDFWEREAVTAAEAGLIRYFKPEYNIIYKNNFPDPAHVHISALYELELHTLVVELQSFEMHTDFWSAFVNPKNVHFAYYPLGELGDIFNF